MGTCQAVVLCRRAVLPCCATVMDEKREDAGVEARASTNAEYDCRFAADPPCIKAHGKGEKLRLIKKVMKTDGRDDDRLGFSPPPSIIKEQTYIWPTFVANQTRRPCYTLD